MLTRVSVRGAMRSGELLLYGPQHGTDPVAQRVDSASRIRIQWFRYDDAPSQRRIVGLHPDVDHESTVASSWWLVHEVTVSSRCHHGVTGTNSRARCA